MNDRPTTVQMVSFVIPVYNEEDNLRQLVDEIKSVADILNHPYEIILVDDGSSDKSLSCIHEIALNVPELLCISLERNSGQSAALFAGFQVSHGDVIITLDADLQNDPTDIPAMFAYYGSNDMVIGWRRRRMDTLSKKIGSKIGNFVRNCLTHERIHDTGCSLKIMRADMLKRIKIYRGMHRFLPTLMRLEGARVLEMPVNHRPRLHGVSKYSNLRRGIEGFQDLLAVRWMLKRHIPLTFGKIHD